MTDPNTTTADSSANGAQRRGFGVDVGGSGVKGGIVDLDTGALIGDRFKILTPQPATPKAVAKTVAAVVKEFNWTGPLGVTYPGVVTNGTVRTAANVDKAWIGTDASEVISAQLNGQPVTVLNDADAAGLAEEKFGAGKDNTGIVVLLTFGTGIGSAVIHNGILLPNTEFGHLEVGGKEAEHRAASSIKETQGLVLRAVDRGSHQGAHRRRERHLARPLHRGWRHQPQGRQVDSAAEEPDARRARRPAEHRRNRRCRHGRGRGPGQTLKTARRRDEFAAQGRSRSHCRYNGRRRPHTG